MTRIAFFLQFWSSWGEVEADRQEGGTGETESEIEREKERGGTEEEADLAPQRDTGQGRPGEGQGHHTEGDRGQGPETSSLVIARPSQCS